MALSNLIWWPWFGFTSGVAPPVVEPPGGGYPPGFPGVRGPTVKAPWWEDYPIDDDDDWIAFILSQFR